MSGSISEAERASRILERLFEEATAPDADPDAWHWLSFADGELPEGQQFLGVAIVQAAGFGLAVHKTHQLGINPGGEVQGVEFPEGMEPIERFTNRLLTREECTEFDREMEAKRPPQAVGDG